MIKQTQKMVLGFAAIASLAMTSASFAQEDGVSTAPNSINVTAGFDNGGFTLGADFEHRMQRTFGVGGYGRFYQKNDDTGEAQQAGTSAFGGFVRPHFYRGMWDLAIWPGFGFVNTDPGTDGDSQFAFGPVIGADILAQLSHSMAIGVEWLSIHTWMNNKVEHNLKETLTVKFRFSF